LWSRPSSAKGAPQLCRLISGPIRDRDIDIKSTSPSVGGDGEVVMVLPNWSIVLIGSIAAICTTSAFVPQVIRVWRLKRADEISLTTFLVLSIGSLVWLTYGLLISSLPVIAANGATFALVLTILALKVKWDRRAAPSVS
jgi:MtN3 and saliva related transmembrane protein